MTKPLRVAFIGAGAMATKVHLPSIKSLPEVEIAGLCDLDEARLQRSGAEFGIGNLYRDYQVMIDKTSPDAVYAIGQPHVMFDIWRWCLEQGLNLYIEKPMGITLHQARLLAYLADKKGCTTQVSFQRRNSPILEHLYDKCREYSPIVHAVCRFYKHNPEPFLNARDHMMDDTVHSIDTLRFVCGGEVVDIESQTRRVGTPDINYIYAALHFDNGAEGYLVNSWTSGRRIFHVEMHAQGACAEVELEDKGYFYADGNTKGEEHDAKQVAGSDELYMFGGFQSKHRDFVECLRSGRKPSSNFSDALKTMEVAEKILAKSLLAMG